MSWNLVLVALAVLLLGGGSSTPPARPTASVPGPMDKIRFDLSVLDEDGLYGPPDGLRVLHYEFCIPATQAHADEVRAVDPSVEVMRGSRGRIGCGGDQYLCVGSTHQPGFRDVLEQLARLEYIDRIEQSFAE